MYYKRVGLLFGSFNPIHNGHLEMMKISMESGLINEGYFVPAKQNPFKPSYSIDIWGRHEMIVHSIHFLNSKIVNKIHSLGSLEENLSGYTIDTLNSIKGLEYLADDFVIICGEDVYYQIITWKEGRSILDNYKFILFNRDEPIISYDENVLGRFVLPKIYCDLSSSSIRKNIKSKSPFWDVDVPNGAVKIIKKKGYYLS